MNTQLKLVTTHQERVMPSPNGYVKLWRDIDAQPWSDDAIIFGVFTKLLMRVSHKPRIKQFKGLDIPLQPGEEAIDYSDIIKMFKVIKDKDHARRIIKKFKSLSQVYTRELKDKNVNLGFIIGFFGWEKWQNCTTPQTTPQTTPKVTDIKGYKEGETTPKTTPQTTHINKNDLTKEKESVPPVAPAPEKPTFLEEREDCFENLWAEWRDCKKNVGNTKKASKVAAKKKFMNDVFPASKVRKIGVPAMASEVDEIAMCAIEMHNALRADQDNGVKGFHPIENMQLPKFFTHKYWEDQE